MFNPSAAFMADPSSLLRLNAAAAAAAQLNPAAALRLMGPAALGQSQPNGNPLFVQQQQQAQVAAALAAAAAAATTGGPSAANGVTANGAAVNPLNSSLGYATNTSLTSPASISGQSALISL